nr:hypothetical protein [uncultured Gemmiger sp.]
MDKRKEENLRVKISITHTLFRLMQTKSLSEITITFRRSPSPNW